MPPKREKKRSFASVARSASDASNPKLSIQERLKQAQTPSESYKAVLKREFTSESPPTTAIKTVVMSLPLRRVARDAPTSVWKAVLKAWTGSIPLGISIISPDRAEIFMDGQVELPEASSPPGCVQTPPNVGPADIKRRAAAYLRGYFKLLRMAALEGFQQDLQLQVIDAAEKMLPKHFSSTADKERWKKTIAHDRALLQPSTSPESSQSL